MMNILRMFSAVVCEDGQISLKHVVWAVSMIVLDNSIIRLFRLVC